MVYPCCCPICPPGFLEILFLIPKDPLWTQSAIKKIYHQKQEEKKKKKKKKTKKKKKKKKKGSFPYRVQF